MKKKQIFRPCNCSQEIFSNHTKIRTMCEEILPSQIALPSQQSSPTMLLTNSRWLLKAPTFRNYTSHLIFRQRIVRTRILRSRGSKMKQTFSSIIASFTFGYHSGNSLLTVGEKSRRGLWPVARGDLDCFTKVKR